MSEMNNLINALTHLVQSQQQLTQALGQQQQQQNAGSTSRISVKIPSYKGEPKENVVAWLLQVQTIFQAQGINGDTTQINYAATGLEAAALHWYLNRVMAAGDQAPFANWDAFATAIRQAFQPPNYQHHLRQQLKRLKQIGSVQEYGSRFRNIVGQIENMNEIDKVTYFVEGLKPATRMEVAYQAPNTFDEAWALAIRFDTAMFGTNRPFSNKLQHQNQRFTPQPQKGNRGPEPMELDYGNNNNYNNNNYNNNYDGKFVPMELDRFETPRKSQRGNCFKCGNSGHYARDCRSKPRPKLTNLE